MAVDSPLKVWIERDGALLRLRLARPEGEHRRCGDDRGLQMARSTRTAAIARISAVLLDAEGPHFSFGASVEEHLPGAMRNDARQPARAAAFHARMAELPILVAVKGQCLGGGLELAMGGSMIFAASDAKMGQPEIQLGVFAPAASVLLPPRIGQAAAEDLLFSGRSIGADEALRLGLVQSVSADPEAAALAYFDQHLAAKSASSLACAVAAVRGGYLLRVRRRIAEVEKLYLQRLMQTRDAKEGLAAFIAKRPPKWEHQ